MSVHISGMNCATLKLLRRFVEATKNYPEDTRIEAGVVGLAGKGLSVAYSDLMGLQTK